MNSRSPAPNQSRKSSDIDTILIRPPLRRNGAHLAMGPATRGRYSTLSHPVARGGKTYTWTIFLAPWSPTRPLYPISGGAFQHPRPDGMRAQAQVPRRTLPRIDTCVPLTRSTGRSMARGPEARKAPVSLPSTGRAPSRSLQCIWPRRRSHGGGHAERGTGARPGTLAQTPVRQDRQFPKMKRRLHLFFGKAAGIVGMAHAGGGEHPRA